MTGQTGFTLVVFAAHIAPVRTVSAMLTAHVQSVAVSRDKFAATHVASERFVRLNVRLEFTRVGDFQMARTTITQPMFFPVVTLQTVHGGYRIPT